MSSQTGMTKDSNSSGSQPKDRSSDNDGKSDRPRSGVLRLSSYTKKNKGSTTTPLQQGDPQIKKVSFCGSLPDGRSSILSANTSPGDMDAGDFETNVDFDDLVKVATGAGSPESTNKNETRESQEAMHSKLSRTVVAASSSDFSNKNTFDEEHNSDCKNGFDINDEGKKVQKFEYAEKKSLQESSNDTFKRTDNVEQTGPKNTLLPEIGHTYSSNDDDDLELMDVYAIAASAVAAASGDSHFNESELETTGKYPPYQKESHFGLEANSSHYIKRTGSSSGESNAMYKTIEGYINKKGENATNNQMTSDTDQSYQGNYFDAVTDSDTDGEHSSSYDTSHQPKKPLSYFPPFYLDGMQAYSSTHNLGSGSHEEIYFSDGSRNATVDVIESSEDGDHAHEIFFAGHKNLQDSLVLNEDDNSFHGQMILTDDDESSVENHNMYTFMQRDKLLTKKNSRSSIRNSRATSKNHIVQEQEEQKQKIIEENLNETVLILDSDTKKDDNAVKNTSQDKYDYSLNDSMSSVDNDNAEKITFREKVVDGRNGSHHSKKRSGIKSKSNSRRSVEGNDQAPKQNVSQDLPVVDLSTNNDTLVRSNMKDNLLRASSLSSIKKNHPFRKQNHDRSFSWASGSKIKQTVKTLTPNLIDKVGKPISRRKKKRSVMNRLSIDDCVEDSDDASTLSDYDDDLGEPKGYVPTTFFSPNNDSLESQKRKARSRDDESFPTSLNFSASYLDAIFLKEDIDSISSQSLMMEQKYFLRAVLQLLAERERVGVEADVDDPNTIKTGPLKKSNTKIGSLWKVKYVEVRKGLFSYYENSLSEGKNKGYLLRKNIPLRSNFCKCRALKMKPKSAHGYVFELSVQGGPRRLWMTNTKAERQSWIEAIDKAMIGINMNYYSSPTQFKSKNELSNMSLIAQFRDDCKLFSTVRDTQLESNSKLSYLDAFSTLWGSTICVPLVWIMYQINDPILSSHGKTFSNSYQSLRDVSQKNVSINGFTINKRSAYATERIVGALCRCFLEHDQNHRMMDTLHEDEGDETNFLAARGYDSDRIDEFQAVLFARDILISCNKFQNKECGQACVSLLCDNPNGLLKIHHLSSEEDLSESMKINVSLIPPSSTRWQQNKKPEILPSIFKSYTEDQEVCGWLTTRSKQSKQWKRRYFVLSGWILSYYLHEYPRPHGLRGQLDLTDASIVTSFENNVEKSTTNINGDDSKIKDRNLLEIGVMMKKDKSIERYFRCDDFSSFMIWKESLESATNRSGLKNEQQQEQKQQVTDPINNSDHKNDWKNSTKIVNKTNEESTRITDFAINKQQKSDPSFASSSNIRGSKSNAVSESHNKKGHSSNVHESKKEQQPTRPPMTILTNNESENQPNKKMMRVLSNRFIQSSINASRSNQKESSSSISSIQKQPELKILVSVEYNSISSICDASYQPSTNTPTHNKDDENNTWA